MTKDTERLKRIGPALLTTVAALMTLGGCSQRNQAGQCVDQNGNVLPDSACRSGSGGYYGGGGGGYRYPHYVYGGSSSGGRVSGGSSVPAGGERRHLPGRLRVSRLRRGVAMERLTLTPRPDWPEKVERLGLVYHTTGDAPYWNEAACYASRRTK